MVKIQMKESHYEIKDSDLSIKAIVHADGRMTVTPFNNNDTFLFRRSEPDLIVRIATLIVDAVEELRATHKNDVKPEQQPEAENGDDENGRRDQEV